VRGGNTAKGGGKRHRGIRKDWEGGNNGGTIKIMGESHW